MKCFKCDLDFPEHLVFENFVGRKICPICASRILNEHYGLPTENPFQGPRARSMFEEAQQFLIKGEGK